MRQACGQWRDLGDLESTSGHHHLAGCDGPVARPEQEVAAGSQGEPVDGRAQDDGRVDRRGVACDASRDLVARHEAVRIGSVVRIAGQRHGPIRAYQAEVIPAIGPASAKLLAPIQQHVLAPSPAKEPAHREACLPRTHDRGVHGAGDRVRGHSSPFRLRAGGVDVVTGPRPCRRAVPLAQRRSGWPQAGGGCRAAPSLSVFPY